MQLVCVWCLGVNTKFGAAGSGHVVDEMIPGLGFSQGAAARHEVRSSKALAYFRLAASFLLFFEIGVVAIGREENKENAEAVPACRRQNSTNKRLTYWG